MIGGLVIVVGLVLMIGGLVIVVGLVLMIGGLVIVVGLVFRIGSLDGNVIDGSSMASRFTKTCG
jgi:hypothetical protein